MAEIIIGITTPAGKTGIVKMTDEELEAYGEEFKRLCQDGGQPMTFERFLRWKAINDLAFALECREDQRMWFIERERELWLRERMATLRNR